MILQDLQEAIYDRLDGDTGTNGLFETDGVNECAALYWNRTPAGSSAPAYPFILMEYPSIDAQHAFGEFGAEILLDVHLFTQTSMAQRAVESRLARIRGELAEPPSYGLHLWQPTVSGMGVARLEWIGRTQVEGRDVLDTVLQFRIYTRQTIGAS